MSSLNPVFLGVTLTYLFLIFCSLSTGDGSCKPENLAGLNHPCGKNLQVSILTRKIFLGLAPFYDAESNSIYFTGGVNGTVYKYCIDSKKLDYKKLGGESVNSIVPIKDVPDHFLISYGDKLALLEWNNRRVVYRIISQPDPAHPWPKYYISYGLMSSGGAFVFFTKPNIEFYHSSVINVPKHQCTIFSLVDGKQKPQIRGLTYGSGPAFSPNGKEFYFSDANCNTTYKATYNMKKNSIENVKVFLEYPHLCIAGRPGVSVFDTEGFLWMATTEGNRLVKLDPHCGTVVCSIKLPITIRYFGFGKCPGALDNKLNCIYLTTSTVKSPVSNLSGPLLVIKGLQSTGYLQNKVPWSTIFGNRENYPN